MSMIKWILFAIVVITAIGCQLSAGTGRFDNIDKFEAIPEVKAISVRFFNSLTIDEIDVDIIYGVGIASAMHNSELKNNHYSPYYQITQSGAYYVVVKNASGAWDIQSEAVYLPTEYGNYTITLSGEVDRMKVTISSDK